MERISCKGTKNLHSKCYIKFTFQGIGRGDLEAMGPIEGDLMEAYNGDNDEGLAKIGTMNRSNFFLGGGQ
jgi:hypothetical protein